MILISDISFQSYSSNPILAYPKIALRVHRPNGYIATAFTSQIYNAIAIDILESKLNKILKREIISLFDDSRFDRRVNMYHQKQRVNNDSQSER